MTRGPRFLLLLLVMLATFLLVSCGGDVEQTVTFYKNEVWEADIEMRLPGEFVALIGSIEEFEDQLDEQIEQWKERDVKATWDSSLEDTTLIYTFHVEGKSLSSLQDTVFDGSGRVYASDEDGKRYIYFSYNAGAGYLSDLSSYRLTLTGDEIVSSNGNETDRGTVQWVNPFGQIEAVLTEKGQFNAGPLVLLAVVIAIGAAGWYFLRQGGILARPQSEPCQRCGTALNPKAGFCPNCGQKRM